MDKYHEMGTKTDWVRVILVSSGMGFFITMFFFGVFLIVSSVFDFSRLPMLPISWSLLWGWTIFSLLAFSKIDLDDYKKEVIVHREVKE
jgi:hypothetical protein